MNFKTTTILLLACVAITFFSTRSCYKTTDKIEDKKTEIKKNEVKKEVFEEKLDIANDSIVSINTRMEELETDNEYWRARYYRRNSELQLIKNRYEKVDNYTNNSDNELDSIITNHRFKPFK